MPTQDISRHLHQPEKHYAGVRMQQGRVILDSDWNERSSIEAEDLRQTISELACSKGTPNAGMSVSNVAVVNPYDFQIANGSYYLGGMRLVIDAADDWETYRTQSDWLQVEAADGSTMTVTAGDRIDLVYVYAWEQPVSAVEDSELFEVALGGRDTSVRMRRMRRFHSMVVSPATNPSTFDSAEGFQKLVDVLNGSNALFDAATSELRSNGLLLVEFSEEQSSEDPCNNPEVEGYVGAENRAIRVELRAGDPMTLTWGFDNASPLYRVKVTEPALDTLTFITEPADLPSMPSAGQVVEILRWGAKLPNVEKVAELQGTLHKVETTYDPTTRQLILDTPVTEDWVEWLTAHAEHYNPDDDADERYLYLRVWDRGRNTTATAEIPYTHETPVVLGDTGLSVTVAADGMPGDYWIIAARTSTPNKFVPWNLDTPGGVPPHGPRRFYAPLALIRWTAGIPEVDDARTRLRTLCEGGCCTVSVGDGKESHGLVDTLQDAIDLLANSGAGGKICVLPGVHEGTALLHDLTDIVIEGCGSRSILTNPRPEIPSSDIESAYTPVLTIEDCTNITVKDLRIAGYHALGVLVQLSEDEEATCSRIRLENLDVECLGAVGGTVDAPFYEQPHSGISVLLASEVDVLDCKVTMANVTTKSYAAVLCGTHLRMHRCTLRAEAAGSGVSKAAGGLNIRSASRDVEVVGCHIEGGKFSGIDLGHRLFVQRLGIYTPLGLYEVGNALPNGGGGGKAYADGPCVELGDAFEDEEPDDPEWVWVPGGPVEDIRIHDNVIRGMGASGISTSKFFPSQFDWDGDDDIDGVPRFIVAAELDIARNLIENNFRQGVDLVNLQNFDKAIGGIVLSACVNGWIHENTIRNNGTGFLRPVCGIGIVAAQNVVIEDNRIVDNGERHPGGNEPWLSPALRGGIVIWEATTVRAKLGGQPTFPVSILNRPVPGTNKNYTEASGESAVIVRGNQVSQPVGKALWIRRGFGPITVTGNSFEGFGDPVNGTELEGVSFRWRRDGDTAITRPARAALVEVINLAQALDIDWEGAELPTPTWVVEGETEAFFGDVLFAHNTMKLTWHALNGYAFAVALSSLGSVVFDSNTVHVSTMNAYGEAPLLPDELANPIKWWLKDVADVFTETSFLMTSCYLGGASTIQATANRLIEEQFAVLFSLACGPALQPPSELSSLQNGGMVAANITGHCHATHTSVTVPALINVALLKDEGAPLAVYDVATLLGGVDRIIVVTAAP
jgi:hypothetical protein